MREESNGFIQIRGDRDSPGLLEALMSKKTIELHHSRGLEINGEAFALVEISPE